MCGRYVLFADARTLGRVFDCRVNAAVAARYNIAPTQPAPVVRTSQDRPGRSLDLLRWGLVPRWANDPAIGQRMINARSESAAEKPAFRDALRYRRCLLPADGFYEWGPGQGRRKQPWFIYRVDGQIMALAGVWEHWQDENGNELESCAILTTEADARLAEVHPRMPLVIEPEAYASWLDPALQDAYAIAPLLRPASGERFARHPVSPAVNHAQRDGPELIEPITPARDDEGQPSLFESE